MGGLFELFQDQCKDCGAPFHFSAAAQSVDKLRGLSPPRRCRDCQRRNAAGIKSVGAAYWQPPVEEDDAKRCWGKFGLGKLRREYTEPQRIDCRPHPVDTPSKKFRVIAPVAERLVGNLERSDGKRVSIVVGPTGTGKSTWVPYRMLCSETLTTRGPMIVTQPRLVTLKRAEEAEHDVRHGGDDGTLPGWVARNLLGIPPSIPTVGPGLPIGVLYRNESTLWDYNNKLLFLTDGVLIHWLTNGDIGRFSVIMVDEAHELSRNMTLIFALLKYQMARYPHLRLVIASATANIDAFMDAFGGPDHVHLAEADPEDASKTNPPIIVRLPDGPGGYLDHLHDTFKLPGEDDSAIPGAVANLVKAIRTQPRFSQLPQLDGMAKNITEHGDILVFVPTIKLVKKTKDALRDLISREGWDRKRLRVFACHAQLDPTEHSDFKKAEQAAAEGTKPFQRIIVATNYAETSVTISNLAYVIDSGRNVEKEWYASDCSQSFPVKWHAKSGCIQRKGRVGRASPGEYFSLVSRSQWGQMRQFPISALTQESLDTFLLSAKMAGINDLTTFEWIGKTPELHAEITRSISSLHAQGAIDDDGDVTNHGVALERLEGPTIDALQFISDSDSYACAVEVATFLAFMDVKGLPFRKAEDAIAWQTGCRDDLEFYLRVFHHWEAEKAACAGHPSQERREHMKEWCRANGLNSHILEDIEKKRESRLKTFSERDRPLTRRILDLDRLHRVRLVLARAMRAWIYEKKGAVYLPYRSDDSDRTEDMPVAIGRDSACAGRPPQFIVAVHRTRQRVKTSNAVTEIKTFAEPVIYVEPQWLPLPDTPLQHALRLRSEVRRDERQTRKNVEADAASLFGAHRAKFHLGQIIECITVRVIGSDEDDAQSGATRTVLACECDTGIAVSVARREGEKARLDPGQKFRAVIEHFDLGRRCLRTSQRGLYKAGGTPAEAIVTEYERTSGVEAQRWCVAISLEPGVEGQLKEQYVPYARREQFQAMPPGQRLRADGLRILTVENDGTIYLSTRVAFENSRESYPVGKEINGLIIIGFNERRTAAYVEIVPGVHGLLIPSALSYSERLEVFEDDLSAGHRMAGKFVIAERPKGKRSRYKVESKEVARNRDRAISEGAEFNGIVVKRDDHRPHVMIELMPGREGRLLTKHATRTEQSLLEGKAGWQRVHVKVRDVNNAKIDLVTSAYARAEEAADALAEGSHVRGMVSRAQTNRDGEITGAIVEVFEAIEFFLPLSYLGRRHAQRRLEDEYAPGSEVNCVVRQNDAADKRVVSPDVPEVVENGTYLGYVSGFLPAAGTRTAAFIEFHPAEGDGFLHVNECSHHLLNELEIGTQLHVRVIAVDCGDRKKRISLCLV